MTSEVNKFITNLFIIGAGGFAREIYSVFHLNSGFGL